MIQIVNLNKNFSNKSQTPVNVLKNISLNFPDKGLIFILGKSGSGKTTLLNLLGGLDLFNDGDILINGNSTVNFKQSDFDTYRNGNVGFVFQDFNLIEDLNVFQNLSLPLHLQGKKVDPILISKILKDFDLDGFELRRVNQLSGGQKQRVAIARSIIKKPSIILADEPTGNLDFATGQQVFEIFKKLSADKLVIIVSHDPESAYNYGQRVIELKDGEVLSDLSKDNSYVSSKQDFKQKSLKIGQIITKEILFQIQNQIENKNHLKNSFIPTNRCVNDSNSVQQSRKMIKISSHLPIKLAFKMGMSYLKEKKFSLISFLLMSSFMFYGQTFTIAVFFGISPLKNFKIGAQELLSKESTMLTIDHYFTVLLKFFVNMTEKIIDETYRNVIGLTLFIFFMVFITVGQFIKKSIEFKKKEIGILRALGARGADVFKIFFSEGFVIAFLISIFGVLFFYFIPFKNFFIEEGIKRFSNDYINSLNKCEINYKDLLPSESILIMGKMKNDLILFQKTIIFCLHEGIVFLSIFLNTFLVVFITIFFPIYSFARKKPIEVILNR
ncbi:ABC transporter ATP-binding protein/permease [Candidatus Phytoplasma prunorum]|uniref:ABC transporter ATP-binding protein/permease n=1 Tax=Candidatus Phytoplasma prunorum TaxID=47565 RepID=UPI002FF40FE8